MRFSSTVRFKHKGYEGKWKGITPDLERKSFRRDKEKKNTKKFLEESVMKAKNVAGVQLINRLQYNPFLKVDTDQ